MMNKSAWVLVLLLGCANTTSKAPAQGGGGVGGHAAGGAGVVEGGAGGASENAAGNVGQVAGAGGGAGAPQGGVGGRLDKTNGGERGAGIGGAGGTTKTTVSGPKENPWINGEFVFRSLRPFVPTPTPNWQSPVNYLDGEMHVRVVMRENPQSKNLWLELIFWQSMLAEKDHDCLRLANPKDLAKPGTYTATARLSDRNMPRNLAGDVVWNEGCEFAAVDYTKPIKYIQIDAKHTTAKGDRVRETFAPPDTPLKFHLTVVLVPKGGKFSGWETYPVP